MISLNRHVEIIFELVSRETSDKSQVLIAWIDKEERILTIAWNMILVLFLLISINLVIVKEMD